MPNDWFQFKQFRIEQDRCAMKVGTDGVILGAWTNAEGCSRALDIGTGTGLLAMMLAQKNSMLNIDAIEIDPAAAGQAEENVNNSPFRDQIKITHVSFQDFLLKDPPKRYDLVICNPPYFSASAKTNSEQRNMARHDDRLSPEMLARGVTLILSAQGRFNLIIPAQNLAGFEMLLSKNNLFINRILEIFPTPEKKAARVCLEVSKKQMVAEYEKLVIETGNRQEYSPEYRSMTDPFYL